MEVQPSAGRKKTQKNSYLADFFFIFTSSVGGSMRQESSWLKVKVNEICSK